MTLRPRPDRHHDALKKFALGLPEASEEKPWGHVAIKVRKKTFVFLAADDDGLRVSVKLPESGAVALGLPFAEPTTFSC